MEGPYRLVRIVRTASSEVYLVWDGEVRVGQVDIHFPAQHPQPLIHATLILEVLLNSEDEEALVDQIDDDIVSAYLPHFDRQDFLISVYRGQEVNHYNDSRVASDPG
ncbi:MAG: hypothetical protein LC772_03890 [Chloroflexi bacterium]|nr:hypothetical protein [Chloroflexota bacterium]